MSTLVVFKAAPGSYYTYPELSLVPTDTSDMLAPLRHAQDAAPADRLTRPALARLWSVALRYPFTCLFLLILSSNLVGSFFNIAYNYLLIVHCCMNEAQQHAFQHLASPLYNLIVYPIGIGLTVWLMLPLIRCRHLLRAGEPVSAAELERCRRRLVNLPFYQVCINFLGWLPGAVFFPLVVCAAAGTYNAHLIWVQFILSFIVSALLTTAQTFFLLELYLIHAFYPDFFQGARPGDVRGVIRVPFALRLTLLGGAVAVPLLALLLVAMNFSDERGDSAELKVLAVAVTVIGGGSGAFVFWLVGQDVNRWVAAHATATEQIEMGNLDIHIREQRPDEWGLLTDRFNDMVAALARGRQLRETFGQIVSPEVRDDIMQNYPGLGGEVETVTVLFADIRGFTRRTAGEHPKRVVELLNGFLTLAVTAVETNGGLVNKFLGDGVMALFGVRRRRTDHADQAVVAAHKLLALLQDFNAELAARGEAPLKIGVGIHTGPALVGCIGATLNLDNGREQIRREFTAIGETVNLAQRLEQLTKCCEATILVSEETRENLQQPTPLVCCGALAVPGYDGRLVVYRVD